MVRVRVPRGFYFERFHPFLYRRRLPPFGARRCSSTQGARASEATSPTRAEGKADGSGSPPAPDRIAP